jgi:hypothetical protein
MYFRTDLLRAQDFVDTKLCDAALTYANDIIRTLGGTVQTELALGQRKKECNCPISNTVRAGSRSRTDYDATKFHVSTDRLNTRVTLYVKSDGSIPYGGAVRLAEVEHPLAVMEFIEEFDNKDLTSIEGEH